VSTGPGEVQIGPGVSNVQVAGGAGGIEAKFEDIAAMGRLTDQVAQDTMHLAVSGQRYLLDENVVASAILDPVGAARFEGAMGLALDGPSGLLATSVGIEARGVAFRATSAAYQAAEEANREALSSVRWLAGAAATGGMGPLNPVLGLVDTAASAAVVGGPIAADVYLQYGGDWQKFLTHHPGLLDNVIGAMPGTASALGLPSNQASLTTLMASAYPQTAPEVNDLGLDSAQTKPPKNLEDVLKGLTIRNNTSGVDNTTGAPVGSNLDVKKITGADGKVSYLVDIPGTKVWDLPGQDHGSVNGMGANLNSLAGNPTTLENGVRDALRRAGVDPSDPVMLVGHSQGGIVAARSAQDFTHSGEFNVTHVITAGSPIGNINVPNTVQVLSLENNGDIVPHLDAAANPDTANRTTVTFDDQANTVLGNHDMRAYTQAGQQLDAGNDPSATAFKQSARNFFNGATVETHQYQVTR
jgi:hypothetical protein